jgi:predicted metalloprotease with PDZ domain
MVLHLKLKSFALFLGIFSLGFPLFSAPISHSIKMPEPQTHYFEITTTVDLSNVSYTKPFVDLKMAAWTPGSYLIREFAKNIEAVKAEINGKSMSISKLNKNTWRVSRGMDVKKIQVTYRVYAFELSVRTSFLDDSHGYINPASVLLYVSELSNLPQEIKIDPFKNFKVVSTALKETSKFTYLAKNLDELIDSPIEIGNHKVWDFKVNGIPHQIAFYGSAKVDSAKFVADVTKVCEETQKVIGEHPCDHYLFILHNIGRGTGGLEHLYSTTCSVSRSAYESERGYQGILGLLAHEYFHLWNVKRIRPKTLGPFDYENENYTHNLWLSEGMTSYYSGVILQRMGKISNQEYTNRVAAEISSVENTPGSHLESAAEASWDAWIKYYRPNENSRNQTVSYYDKGSLLGYVLNAWIIKSTQGQKSIDDVFKYLYQAYYKKLNRGFTDAELEDAFSKIAGNSAKPIFESYIYGVQTPDYQSLFHEFGYTWSNSNEGKSIPYLGFTVMAGKITSVYRGASAYVYGLNVGDEIVSANKNPFESLDKLLADKKVGDTILFTVKRDGLERSFMVPVQQSPLFAFSLTDQKTLTDNQKKLRMKWLGSL